MKKHKEVSITVKEAASLLGCADQTVLNYIHQEKIKAKKVFGKWRISKKSVTDLLDSFEL